MSYFCNKCGYFGGTSEHENCNYLAADINWKDKQLEKDLSEANERADKAEAMLKAAGEQEPYRLELVGGGYDSVTKEHICQYVWRHPVGTEGSLLPERLYAAPIPQSSNVYEQKYVDCLIADKDKRIAELERKLAEQQALFVEMGKHPDNPSLYAMYMSCRNYYNANEPTELNTLLSKEREEGRRDAVPEVVESLAQWFEKNYSQGNVPAKYIRKQGAILAGAPKPEVKP